MTSLFLFVISPVVTSNTVDVIFLAVVIDVFKVYLAVDVTTVPIVFFPTVIVVAVTVAVAFITIDTVSVVLIKVLFVVALVPTIKIDAVYHTVINVVLVDFFVSFIFAVFVVVFICYGMPQFRCS